MQSICEIKLFPSPPFFFIYMVMGYSVLLIRNYEMK